MMFDLSLKASKPNKTSKTECGRKQRSIASSGTHQRNISVHFTEFQNKTHRTQGSNKGFNAMFAVSSVDAAKCYYDELNDLQKESDKPLKIATIFSLQQNEEQSAIGEIADETFEPSAMDVTAKEFLTKAINDYNAMFKTSYSVDSNEFQNYYRDLAKRVKQRG